MQQDVSIAGIALSSPGRAVFPGISKLDLAQYYQRIAPQMLTETADRPLSLLRLPEGIDGARFFQKHPGKGFPATLETMQIREADGDLADYIYVRDASGLVGAVQMGTVEFHIWGAHRNNLERPDRLIFDLDPDEALDFAEVRRAALDLRETLGGLGLEAWAMLSGGKGVHLVVPLKRTASWDHVKQFCQRIAQLCAAREPDRFVAEMAKAKRKGRIFIDWLRNERGQTSVAPFSVRARSGAPVAAPVSWEEMPGIASASAFDMAAAWARGWPVQRPKAQKLTQAILENLDQEISKYS